MCKELKDHGAMPSEKSIPASSEPELLSWMIDVIPPAKKRKLSPPKVYIEDDSDIPVYDDFIGAIDNQSAIAKYRALINEYRISGGWFGEA